MTVTLLMAFLYSFDVNALQKCDDGDEQVLNLPIINDPEFANAVNSALQEKQVWEWDDRIKPIAFFAYGLSLSRLLQAPQNLQENALNVLQMNEQLVDKAIELRVFDFIYYYVLENETIFK